jgi:hypothetical protein
MNEWWIGIEVRYRYLPVGTEENHETLRIADVPKEIRTEHLPNMIQERYRCSTRLDSIVLL